MLGPFRRRTWRKNGWPRSLSFPKPPIVVLAIKLPATLGQVMFDVPQTCRLFDLAGFVLCFLNQFLQVALQSSVESFVGDGLFRPRLPRFVLVGKRCWLTNGLFMLRPFVVAFYALRRRGFYRRGRLHCDRVHFLSR